MEGYEPVAFVSAESGDGLVVSFFVIEPDDPTNGRSIILMRNPNWEDMLSDYEKGVTVSDEGHPEDDAGEDNFLERIRLGNATAEIRSKRYRHRLDLRRVEKSQLREGRKVLKKMNYDKSFKLELS